MQPSEESRNSYHYATMPIDARKRTHSDVSISSDDENTETAEGPSKTTRTSKGGRALSRKRRYLDKEGKTIADSTHDGHDDLPAPLYAPPTSEAFGSTTASTAAPQKSNAFENGAECDHDTRDHDILNHGIPDHDIPVIKVTDCTTAPTAADHHGNISETTSAGRGSDELPGFATFIDFLKPLAAEGAANTLPPLHPNRRGPVALPSISTIIDPIADAVITAVLSTPGSDSTSAGFANPNSADEQTAFDEQTAYDERSALVLQLCGWIDEISGLERLCDGYRREQDALRAELEEAKVGKEQQGLARAELDKEIVALREQSSAKKAGTPDETSALQQQVRGLETIGKKHELDAEWALAEIQRLEAVEKQKQELQNERLVDWANRRKKLEEENDALKKLTADGNSAALLQLLTTKDAVLASLKGDLTTNMSINAKQMKDLQEELARTKTQLQAAQGGG